MTPVFRLCDEFVTQWATLDPVAAGARGLGTPFGAATDYGPDGLAAWEDLATTTLAELDLLDVASDEDRRAASFLRERLSAELAWRQAGEPLRAVNAPFGRISSIRDSVDLLPRGTDDEWRDIAARLRAIPEMFRGWRVSLELGLSRGLAAARRQALECAVQAERYAGSPAAGTSAAGRVAAGGVGTAGTHDALVASYGDGRLAGELADAAAAAHAGYASLARWLREDYAPKAAPADPVGADRYALAARLSLGADMDMHDAYRWGWEELDRVEAEMSAEADRIKSGATVAEATAILDRTQVVTGADAYLRWLQDRHDQAVDRLNGTLFDIPEPLRTIEAVLARGSSSGAAYYTSPSEDFTRPGRTWWPVTGRDTFETWSELSTVFHEGVPGHHLQAGAARIAGDRLSRFARTTFVSGHGEGWALYAERLSDELGWFDEPGTRLGMLAGSALRAARVVIDIGVHLDLPLPDGSRWTFEKACVLLRDRGHAEPHRVHAEVVRYFGWPAQAISYKLGERAWLAARAEAQRRPGFDLKTWHTDALALGPIGLAALTEELRRLS